MIVKGLKILISKFTKQTKTKRDSENLNNKINMLNSQISIIHLQKLVMCMAIKKTNNYPKHVFYRSYSQIKTLISKPKMQLHKLYLLKKIRNKPLGFYPPDPPNQPTNPETGITKNLEIFEKTLHIKICRDMDVKKISERLGNRQKRLLAGPERSQAWDSLILQGSTPVSVFEIFYNFVSY